MELSGLVLKNAGGIDITITGSGTLSLGAAGLSIPTAAKSLTLTAPVSIVAAQSWMLGATPTDFRASVDGTSNWTVDCTGLIRVYQLGYDGFVTYTGEKGQVRFLAGKDWAQKVRLATTGDTVLCVTNTVEWSEIVTGGTMELAGAGNVFVCQPSVDDAGTTGMPGCIVFRDGDSLACVEDYKDRKKTICVAQGFLDQRGGTIIACDRYQSSVGGVTKGYNGIEQSLAGYNLSEGTYSAAFLKMGEGTRSIDSGDSVRIVQTGGTMDVGSGLWINDSPESSRVRFVNEYVLGGGTLNVGGKYYGGWNNAQSAGLVVAGAHAGATKDGFPAGVFTMTNGTLNARYVHFGVDKIDNQKWQNDQSFGLFDMRGGEMPLGEVIPGSTKATMTEGFSVGQYWNNGTDPRSVYRINLSGGTISVGSGDWVNRFGFFFPALPEASFTWDTGEGNTDFVAPISGSGKLRKKGTGTMLIRDGSCFDGTLEIVEGAVTVPIVFEADDISGDCYKWTADSLTDAEDGGEVAEWVDSIHGLKAGVNDTPTGTWCLPTYVASSAKFNGHAALAFKTTAGNASLVAAPDMLADARSCTVVAVFRRPETSEDNANAAHGRAVCGLGGTWAGTVLRIGLRCESPRASATPYAYAPVFSSSDAQYWRNEYALVTNGIPYDVGAEASCHVVIATVDNGRYSVFSDGQYAERTNPFWDENSKLQTDMRKFFFGGYVTDGSNLAGGDLEIAEVRVYPNRALTLAEQRQLGTHLFATYRGVTADERLASMWYGDHYGMIEMGTESVPERPEGGVSWNAAALNALDAASGCGKPTLVEKSFGGEDAIRFDGASALTIPAAQSSLSGASAFTMAVVFRTLDDGAKGLDTDKDGQIGLVSSRSGSAYGWDAILALYRECAVGIECGNANESYRIRNVDRRPCRLNDGNAHVAVMAVTPTSTDAFTEMVDGRYNTWTLGFLGTAKWPSGQVHDRCNVYVGAKAALENMGFFKGDIAEVVLYGRQLSRDEMTALSENLAAKYRFRLLPTHDFSDTDVAARGLRASNIVVRKGASLRMPLATTGAYALAPGATLSGSGAMLGSYAFGNGATLDLATDTPTALSDVQMMNGGRIRVDVSKPFRFENFSASGTVELELVDFDETEYPQNVTLFSFENEPSFANDTVFHVRGNLRYVVEMKDGKLRLHVPHGLQLVIR